MSAARISHSRSANAQPHVAAAAVRDDASGKNAFAAALVDAGATVPRKTGGHGLGAEDRGATGGPARGTHPGAEVESTATPDAKPGTETSAGEATCEEKPTASGGSDTAGDPAGLAEKANLPTAPFGAVDAAEPSTSSAPRSRAMSGDDVSALAPGLISAVVLATAPDPATAKLAAGAGEPADPETIAPATASSDGRGAVVSGARSVIVSGAAAQPVASASTDLPSALFSARPDRSALIPATAMIEPAPATPDPASAPQAGDGTGAGAPPDPGQAAASPVPANETELTLIPASFSVMTPAAVVPVSSDTATEPRDRFKSSPAAALDLDQAASVSAAAPPVTAPAALPAAAGTLDTGSLRPGEPGFAQAFSDHVVRLAANPGSEVTVQLHPPALGELTVRVAVSGHDVSAWFGSAQPLVQQAISEALGQLQTGLGNAGYTLAGAWVGADASGGRDQGYGGAPRRSAVALAGGMPSIGGASPANHTASRINVYV